MGRAGQCSSPHLPDHLCPLESSFFLHRMVWDTQLRLGAPWVGAVGCVLLVPELAGAFPVPRKHRAWSWTWSSRCPCPSPFFTRLWSHSCLSLGSALGSGFALQGKAPASGWARAEMASRLNQLPHFQFKEIMKSRKCWVRAGFHLPSMHIFWG